MSAEATRATLVYRTVANLKGLADYRTALWQRLSSAVGAPSNPCAREQEEQLNPLLRGYPRNHNYAVVRKRLIPGFKLCRRLELIRRLYPQPLESLLDIGCCRGFFVLDAAQRPTCRIAAGVDVYRPFVATAETVREHLQLENATFHCAALREVADEPEAYGGPFQTVLLVGTYHYLFWGSSLCATAYHDHRAILQQVARLCTDRCIFSARLEMDRLPDRVKQTARSHLARAQYTTEHFLRSAEEFFQVRRDGFLGAYPVFVLTKKNGRAGQSTASASCR
jgi:hypothetical protein